MTIDTKQTIASVNIERVPLFASPVIAPTAISIVASVAMVATGTMVG